jgi:hypothetical protein
MRMWMVKVELLCNSHLLGEHFELHKHRHNFVKGHSIAGRKGQIEPVSMKQRHDELAKEMELRGYKHNSPYEQPDLSHYDLKDFIVDKEKSLIDLCNRCPNCNALVQEKKIENFS